MMKTFILSTALVVAGASASSAQGFNGAELGLEFGFLNDEGETVTNYYGGAEFSVYRQFGLAVDVRSASTSANSDNGTSLTRLRLLAQKWAITLARVTLKPTSVQAMSKTIQVI